MKWPLGVHRKICHHQHRVENKQTDGNMPWGVAQLKTDFAMNLTHSHPKAAQEEHWSARQTTILPTYAYYKRPFSSGRPSNLAAGSSWVPPKTEVWAEGYHMLTEDLHHDNPTVQQTLWEVVARLRRKVIATCVCVCARACMRGRATILSPPPPPR
jgi:hypothetical protein